MEPLHKFNSTYQLHAFQNVAFQFIVVAKINLFLHFLSPNDAKS